VRIEIFCIIFAALWVLMLILSIVFAIVTVGWGLYYGAYFGFLLIISLVVGFISAWKLFIIGVFVFFILCIINALCFLISAIVIWANVAFFFAFGLVAGGVLLIIQSLFCIAFCVGMCYLAYLSWNLFHDLGGMEAMCNNGGQGKTHTTVIVTQQPVQQQPVVVQETVVVQQPVVQQQPAQSKKQVNYAAPIVTYAQPIVQALDTTAPQVADQSYTAAPIVQPTYQVAPVQNVQAISATAPTINKGFGSGMGLGALNYGGY